MSRLSELLTVKEAAAIKDVPEDTIRRRIARGRLPAIKKGDIWLIRRRDLDAWEVRRRHGDEEQGTKGGMVFAAA